MPAKSKGKKGKGKATKAKSTKAKAKKNVKASKELVTYMAPQQLPLPPKYRTKFTAKFFGSVPAAAGSASRTWLVNFNDPSLPFAYTGTGTFGASTNLFDAPSIANNTLNPTGFTTLWNTNMYQAARVYSSSIALEMIPSALADTVEAYIMPISAIPAAGFVVGTSNYMALSQPLTKSQIFSSSKTNNIKNKGQLVNYCSQHKLLGVSKRAIEDDLSGNYEIDLANNTPNPLVPTYWQLGYDTLNKADLATFLDYRISVTYYVELYSLNVGQLLQV